MPEVSFRRLAKKIKNWLIYWLIRFLIFSFNLLPRRVSIFLGASLGRLAYFVIPKARKKTIRNLKIAFGKNESEVKVKEISQKVFENIGKNVVDAARIKKMDRNLLEELIRVEGERHLKRAYQKGEGVIGITGHIGNFELMAAYFSLKGYRISVVGRELYDPRLNEILVKTRRKMGLENISSSAPIKDFFKALNSGRMLGVLADQDTTRVRGIFVDFFGRPALTPVGPMLLALKKKVPLIPMAIFRNGYDKYKIVIKDEVNIVSTTDKKKDLYLLTQKCAQILESFIRENPTQWVWMHDRWRHKPAK